MVWEMSILLLLFCLYSIVVMFVCGRPVGEKKNQDGNPHMGTLLLIEAKQPAKNLEEDDLCQFQSNLLGRISLLQNSTEKPCP